MQYLMGRYTVSARRACRVVRSHALVRVLHEAGGIR